MTFTPGEELDITATSFDALISYIEHSDNFWLIKDKNYRFVYINKIGKYYLDLREDYRVEGRCIGEIPTQLSNFQDVIHDTNDKVISGQKKITAIFNATYQGENKFIQSFIFDNTPLIRHGKCVGLIGRGRKIELFTMDNITGNKLPDAIQFGNPSELFTDREFDVIFYALQSLTSKEIAKALSIQPKSVETHLYNIYKKMGVSTRSQLIMLCRCKGYDKYVPAKFLGSVPIKFFE